MGVIILQGVFSVTVYENIQVFFGGLFRWSIANFQLTLLAMGVPYNAALHFLLFAWCNSTLEFFIFALNLHLIIGV